MKIIGNTVGTTTPKPNLMQTDPKKGDFVFGRDEFAQMTSGIYVGSGEMPEGYNIQIDPDGDPFCIVKTLLIDILRNAVFTSDQSANITALESALAGNERAPEVPDESETICSVRNNLSKVTTSNSVTSVIAGSSYNATLTPAAGYQMGNVMVTMGDVDITSSAYSDGKITIASVTDYVIITATAKAISYTVTNKLTEVTTNNNTNAASYGSAYTATLTPSEGHSLSSVTVTMGGVNITSSAYSNGKVTIRTVTGDVVITAVAVEITDETVYYSVTYNLTNVTSSQNTPSISENTILYIKLTPDDGYVLDTVLVTMGGVDVTDSVYGNSEISVTPTGDIVITAAAVKHNVQTEELTKVWTTSYPDITKFEFTESATPTGGQSYQCTKRNTIAGGLIKVDYDPTVVNKFDMNIYIFNADGQPYKHSYDEGSHFGNNTNIFWGDPGSGAGFCNVYAPFELQLEEGCTFIACFRRGNFCEVLSDTVTNTNLGVAQWIRDNVKITVTG